MTLTIATGNQLAAPPFTDGRLAFSRQRRRTHVVMVGSVAVGGDNPIRVQSMTTTSTLDTAATVAQVERLVRAGCEIVRITAQTTKEARQLREIKASLRAKGIGVPLVADIHFSPDAALEAAEHVEKVRVNPGNYADSRKFAVRSYTDAEYAAELGRIEARFAPLVLKCQANRIAMRIGTNHGSLSDRIVNRFGDTPEGMVESALEFVRICEKYAYDQVILSMKASNVKVMIAAYRLLAARMAALGMTYPFHLGVTEAGNGEDGRLKSAIGIGSLLADGIGDTIRVSLTEEPEAEVPVAYTLANHFTPRDELSLSPPPAPHPRRWGVHTPGAERAGARPVSHDRPSPRAEGSPWDPFHYARRVSRRIAVGPVAIGGESVVAVVARAGDDREARVLRWASPGARRLRRPDLVEWTISNEADVEALARLRARLGQAARTLTLASADPAPLPKLALLASGGAAAHLELALPFVDGILLTHPTVEAAESLARATRAAGKPLWLEARVPGLDSADPGGGQPVDAVQELVAAHDACRAAGQDDLVLGITASTPEAFISAQRLLAGRLALAQSDAPVFLRADPTDDRLIASALPIGSLLADGFGDAVQAGLSDGGQLDVELTLNVLQAVGTRLSKTDYVACPSCGRTLFDLQTTTDRIKEQTSHLVGVKIAIMGCVVNGPGEMADADFGYVGGAPGHVNLYVGRACVERGIPTDVADARLIALIKEHDRWQEPEADDE
ncbi:MAG: (E)-4-hydroxy-3-methylbut-2-enyl-diphosphate synthase [Chloroflexota bacterium]